MAQTTVSVRMDDQLKRQFETFCGEFGMSLSTAVTVFAKTVVRERRIPFEITVAEDPLYSGANKRHLDAAIAQWNDPSSPKIVKTMAELEAMANE
ncbi:MAG: type II toxin-antitoxin system RelB/DinJ family antitoxin [Oscillospiraceae bacterium]|nr:type II toxin-antitoxin system RelB/DinJ family antitoxin [Oscillospiraceae bacterium]